MHNRVKGIEKIASEVARLVPEARVDIAHGLNNPDSQFQLYLNIGADL